MATSTKWKIDLFASTLRIMYDSNPNASEETAVGSWLALRVTVSSNASSVDDVRVCVWCYSGYFKLYSRRPRYNNLPLQACIRATPNGPRLSNGPCRPRTERDTVLRAEAKNDDGTRRRHRAVSPHMPPLRGSRSSLHRFSWD